MTESPTWKNTLHDSVRGFGSISDFAATCHKLGYPYMCWNDRIYSVSKQTNIVKWVDTNLLMEDVGRNYMPTIEDTIVLACTIKGEPAMVRYDVKCTEEQYNEGEHYEKAKDKAEEDGYAAPFICFDSSEYHQVISMAEEIKSSE